MLKTFSKITVKHTLRVCLTIILGSAFDLFNVWKIKKLSVRNTINIS